jgi:predicted nucleic acid-binding protein
LFSIIQVRQELRRGNDQLSRWVRELPDSFWVRDNTPAVASALAELAIWADSSGRYKATAVQVFLGAADYYLAAQGKATGYTVVTNETRAPRSTSSIKLPDACDAISVPVITPFEWMRREATRF